MTEAMSPSLPCAKELPFLRHAPTAGKVEVIDLSEPTPPYDSSIDEMLEEFTHIDDLHPTSPNTAATEDDTDATMTESQTTINAETHEEEIAAPMIERLTLKEDKPQDSGSRMAGQEAEAVTNSKGNKEANHSPPRERQGLPIDTDDNLPTVDELLQSASRRRLRADASSSRPLPNLGDSGGGCPGRSVSNGRIVSPKRRASEIGTEAESRESPIVGPREIDDENIPDEQRRKRKKPSPPCTDASAQRTPHPPKSDTNDEEPKGLSNILGRIAQELSDLESLKLRRQRLMTRMEQKGCELDHLVMLMNDELAEMGAS
ncbi:MAG: hypothetical protein M1817_000674 [Caeruleum heppii]|nr:MAG: hypothetical protein M1817_000674 [Caeruleum heppii]